MDTIDYYQPSTNPLKVARESMAFRGPLLSWLEGLIRVPGAGPQHASVDVQDVGALPVGTTLHFRVAHGDKETMLRFDQACIPCTDDPTEVTCQVRRVGEQAIILVTHDDGVHTPAVTLCVEASRDPHLDAQAANPLIDFTSPTEPRTGPAGRHRHITIWLFKAIQPAPWPAGMIQYNCCALAYKCSFRPFSASMPTIGSSKRSPLAPMTGMTTRSLTV